ncbi:Alpha/Beta hydrolase protein [Chaetomium fimeti]|uniref:Alpha/Beta hydrolase protein n=1 Tax=Chaetomium fimeti TaxID=1854472 RepID=A0AAE0LRX1_9PEZI|nr:Alpha/Beta hydrolase protein [Chaetomium fimeti]
MSLCAFGTVPPGALSTPAPFKLSVPAAQQDKLTKLVSEAEIAVPSYYNTHADTTNTSSFGLSRDWLVDAQEAWTSGEYSWRAEQQRLNRFPHFRINITTTTTAPNDDEDDNAEDGTESETFDLHFAALFSRSASATPVVLMHGWPGSWIEFGAVLDLLAARYTAETLPYHVVVPSLPDYGLSTRRGELRRPLTMEGAAGAIDGLMAALGFGAGYVAQGGDVGAIVGQVLCAKFEACKALHRECVRLLVLLTPPFMSANATAAVAGIPVTPAEQAQLARSAIWGSKGTAYVSEHGTRPSTIALALSTNPLAMLSWMGEKFIEWSDNRFPLSLNTILSLTSFYWFTNSFGRGLWAYSFETSRIPVPFSSTKPFGYSAYPLEVTAFPKAWAEHLYPNLVLYRTHDKVSQESSGCREETP